MRSIALVLALVLESSLVFGGESMSADVEDRLRKATVMIQAATPDGQIRMAGFLVQSDNGDVVVVTSARAVQRKGKPARNIECRSTTHGKTLPAKIVELDTTQDVAVLQIAPGHLSEPIRLPNKSDVHPGMTVYGCGFATPDAPIEPTDNLTVLISKGSVSTVKRDAVGNILFIQTDKAVTAGNSGGPLVDGDGQLVGISVAQLRGTTVGMAGPVANVKRLVDQRIAKLPNGKKASALR